MSETFLSKATTGASEVSADLVSDRSLDGGCPGATAPFMCGRSSVDPVGGIRCSYVAFLAECVDGEWRCPTGEMPLGHCDCNGAPILLCSVCTTSGWSLTCTDGGADGSGGG